MRSVARILYLSVALALGACALPDMDSFRPLDTAAMFRPTSVTGLKETRLRPVTGEDLIDAEGRCAALAAQAPEVGAEQASTPPGVPLVPAGVALEMTECDVVKRVGPAEKVELGTNNRSERTATLTYIRGARPGIYHFIAGRLASVERAPEPPAPAKPARPAKPAKPKPRSAT